MHFSFKLPLLSIAMASTLGFAGMAGAQEVTGAGASFPAPIYSKWASDYNKATGVKVNYQMTF
jgi:phosphate transport system substrate-binding protein